MESNPREDTHQPETDEDEPQALPYYEYDDAGKLHWFKFDHTDWKRDAALSRCTLASRGAWIELICAMHEEGRVGTLCGTLQQLARIARCEPAELDQALTDLQATGTANVTRRNGTVTVVCRRLDREHKVRVANRIRKEKWRASRKRHADVTGKKPKPPSNLEPPPPSIDSPAAENVDTRSERGGGGILQTDKDRLAARLTANGVRRADCLDQALRAGYSIEKVGAIIDYFELNPGAWQSGAIYTRLTEIPPSVNTSEGWPKPEATYVRQKEKAAQNASRDVVREIDAKRRAEAAAECERLRALKAKHKATLDAMKPAEKADLIRRAGLGHMLDKNAQVGHVARITELELVKQLECEEQGRKRGRI